MFLGNALVEPIWKEAWRQAAHAISHLFFDSVKGSSCLPCPSLTCPVEKFDVLLIEKFVRRNVEYDTWLLLLACLSGFFFSASTVTAFSYCCHGARGRTPSRRGSGVVVY